MVAILGTLYFFYILTRLFIAMKEISFVARAKEATPVVLGAENYKKAAAYKIASERFGMIGMLVDYGLFLCWISFGLRWLESFVITQGGIWESVLFVILFVGINYLVSLPLDLYGTFVKDKAFGFTTIDMATYFKDQLKAAAIFLVAGSAVIALVAWIMGTFATWWLWGFVALFVIVLFINMIYPTLIAPIFNTFTPLKDEALAHSIEALLDKAGLKSSGVFTIDASKRDKRLNAYFGGLGKSKRVVLFDTLVEKLEKNELLAVLGHELGHFKHKDMLKNIAISGGMLFVMFAIFGNLPVALYGALGVASGPHSTIALFLLLSPLISFVLMPLMGALSRHNEYKADEYGSACESKAALRGALTKLADENKSFPLSHPLSIAFYHTHPPLVERLKRLE